jgi:hypothetical protein
MQQRYLTNRQKQRHEKNRSLNVYKEGHWHIASADVLWSRPVSSKSNSSDTNFKEY